MPGRINVRGQVLDSGLTPKAFCVIVMTLFEVTAVLNFAYCAQAP
jgi:hypothetical protein